MLGVAILSNVMRVGTQRLGSFELYAIENTPKKWAVEYIAGSTVRNHATSIQNRNSTTNVGQERQIVLAEQYSASR